VRTAKKIQSNARIQIEQSDSGQQMFLRKDIFGNAAGLWQYANGRAVPLSDRSAYPCPTDCGGNDDKARPIALVRYAPGCGPNGCTPQNDTMRQVALFVALFFVSVLIIKS